MIESNNNIIQNLDSSNDLIKKEAFKMNDYLKSNEAFNIALETLKSELDYNTAILSAKEDGIEEGLQKGIEQGIAQNQKEIILYMYKKGMSKEDISEMTGINIGIINEIIE